MTATAIRGKDWIFNAFWAACGESNAPRCSVSIPVTIMFNNGSPFKALSNDHGSGTVRRIDLYNVPTERNGGERGFRGESFRTIRALRQLLLEYAAANGYDQYQADTSQEIILCNVSSTRRVAAFTTYDLPFAGLNFACFDMFFSTGILHRWPNRGFRLTNSRYPLKE